MLSFLLFSVVLWCLKDIHSPCTASVFCLISVFFLSYEGTIGLSLLVAHVFPYCGVEAEHRTWMQIPFSNTIYFPLMVVLSHFPLVVSRFLVIHQSKNKSCLYDIIIMFFFSSLMQDNIVPQYQDLPYLNNVPWSCLFFHLLC